MMNGVDKIIYYLCADNKQITAAKLSWLAETRYTSFDQNERNLKTQI